ncbi:AraC family transcriptional regulator of adaptative response / DNA-3-methyladenine glycosylase II [Psychromicrobium silvestre]|uniref:DNA-3-methyladenine glycosylase II n=1 Tax=Psychromicrobium silvestre TaxID=1645614 RepID=A0A7Y9S487_9MICC|nr:AlkA N-terminal domain-containing protein [Psychromicrobium silvestre]NYE93815.1 AraC family transcriptional regulator of adaptative response / DNA-3-methyladenine glycosylase II [Psychromicrobium silvestre]
MDFEQSYRAIDAKDSRFDGQFYTAVRSTGIYCRPSCPARTPLRQNVSFYPTSAAAHEAGYRACKRCLPEAAPGTPEWNLRSDVAARAMRLIIDGELNADRGGVNQLATQLGYSSRQLGRILRAELGAGPLALARAARAQTARTLLTSTGMKFSEIAFASGFASIRQFNETVQQVFDLSPSQLRAAALDRHPDRHSERHSERQEHAEPGTVEGTTLDLRLPLRPPYDPGIFAFLAARAVDGVEIGTASSYARSLALPHGTASVLVTLPELAEGLTTAERAWATDHLRLRATVQNLKDLPSLLARVRRVFDLDADPVAIDTQLAESPALRERVEQLPGIRLPGAVDAAEMLLRAMVGQQITVVAARGQLHRLATLGESFVGPEPQLNRLFPTPRQLAEGGAELLRGPQRRTDSILNAMRELDRGLHLGLDDDPDSLRAKLLPLPGIGPWTVNYLAMRLLGATDIHLDGDVAVRKGLETVGLSAQDTGSMSPWRSYATVHFWRSAAETTPQRKNSPGKKQRK